MKGLILKDLYMMRKYNMSFLLIFAVFMVVSFFGGENSFFYSISGFAGRYFACKSYSV